MAVPGLLLGLVLPLVLLVDKSAGDVFRFASYIDDYMVLQKEPSGAVIWGYSTSLAEVVVTLTQQGKPVMKKTTYVRAYSDVWMVILDPMKAGGPYELTAQQTTVNMNSTLFVHDVLFGDVWLCSGQSNMEMTVSQIFNATAELYNTAAYQSVRILSLSLVQSGKELEDIAEIDLGWSTPSAENLGHGSFTYMSAVCWLFGRSLYDNLHYPIGLISSCWGGTPIEAWSSKRPLKTCGVPWMRMGSLEFVTGPREYSVLWNAMIYPLHKMTLKGVIWYQGESNQDFNRDLYNCTFPELIDDWRQTFHFGSQRQTHRLFPFGFVQLSSYETDRTSDEKFPEIRWHQTADFGYAPNIKMPNTFMAVAMDLGDRSSPFGSIHPRDKQTVAYRLLLGALAVGYGEKLLFQGPMPEKIQFMEHEGLLILTYTQQIQVITMDTRLFMVSCCDDYECSWIPVSILTSSVQTLTLDIHYCTGTPVAVRYAWTTWPCEYKSCPLYHPTSTLPAPPFTAVFDGQNPETQLLQIQL